MRNYEAETIRRTTFIRERLNAAGAEGIVYGNSGGKDSALVGILCKMACDNTVGLIMPCESKRNFSIDRDDALAIAKHFKIDTREVDITKLKKTAVETLGTVTELSPLASANINARLRMITLYAVAASENRLVAGTGNRSEAYVGYFTKWGDGANDFNPIADLTVSEIYEFLEYLGCPDCVIKKVPSAALYDGQTDESEMGISYSDIDAMLLGGSVEKDIAEKIEKRHAASEHKRNLPYTIDG
jgi:NAD+ synthase